MLRSSAVGMGLLGLLLTAACAGKTEGARASGGGAGIDGGASGGAAGTGGVGGSTGNCPGGTKLCGAQCELTQQPGVGCAAASCDPCVVPNAVATCSSGQCAIGSCDDAWADCDGDPLDGCEVNTLTDEHHCGACGLVCPVTAICVGAKCQEDGSCGANPFLFNCDGDPANGCEIDSSSDADNCGFCGNACAANQTCVNGKCQ